jgi:hypothetical protein
MGACDQEQHKGEFKARPAAATAGCGYSKPCSAPVLDAADVRKHADAAQSCAVISHPAWTLQVCNLQLTWMTLHRAGCRGMRGPRHAAVRAKHVVASMPSKVQLARSTYSSSADIHDGCLVRVIAGSQRMRPGTTEATTSCCMLAVCLKLPDLCHASLITVAVRARAFINQRALLSCFNIICLYSCCICYEVTHCTLQVA